MKPKTLVIIDDDADDLDIFKEAVTKLDPNLLCISFLYADEAIRLLCTELILLPDYIFIDINMPRLNGLECLRQLRRIEEFRRIPITIYSTHLPADKSDEILDLGATHTFQKPYSVNDLIKILEGIILDTSSPGIRFAR